MLDALVVMLLPLVISRVLPWLKEVLGDLWQWLTKDRLGPEQHRRDISFTYQPNQFYSYDSDQAPNHKLQKAILVGGRGSRCPVLTV